MKYRITESKINQIILSYLNDNMYPDYDWGHELHDFYRREIWRYNTYTFPINDVESYTYYGEYNGQKNLLEILPQVSEPLTSLFGDKWIPVFKEWFEKNSGLEVDNMDIW